MFYAAIVVDNKDVKSRIKVFVPRLMSTIKPENAAEYETKIVLNRFENKISNDAEILSELGITEADTIIAYPLLYNYSATNGQKMVPEVGDLVLVTFLNDDYSQSYYICGSPYIQKEKYDLDYKEFIEDKDNNSEKPESSPKQKVLYKSKGDSIIAMDDNDNSKSVIIKANNHHKVKLERNSDKDEINIKTGNNNDITLNDKERNIKVTTTDGHVAIMDDANKSVSITTAGGHQIKADDIIPSVNITTTAGHEIMMNDAISTVSITTAGGHSIIINDTTGTITINSTANTIINSTATTTVNSPAVTVNSLSIDLGGVGGKGVVTGDCICHFTGLPHADTSLITRAKKI
jgi:hypothetical protein